MTDSVNFENRLTESARSALTNARMRRETATTCQRVDTWNRYRA
jgi:hypothetical protein